MKHMNVMKMVAAGLLGSAVLGGCGTASIVGTWHASGEPGAEFSVAEATFRDDRTYSAEVLEGGREITDSGEWSKRGKELELRGQHATRVYQARVSGDELVMTDPQTGQSQTFERGAPGD